ncbi:SDR family oxidoreductase [Rugamonas sp.]|uniref:SDR family NAD(P)-dependent oxidoreductase n=1 Tax=Rugamonas sp. TaxID=1926287 RepID=UPI0025E58E6A|nr:SDR family oxidoreductase [Rugamonas sp.]
MSNKLNGKVAVVTGASAGIGLAAAKRYAAEGAQVFITGRRQSELDKAVAEIGNGVIALQGDVANMDDLDRIYSAVKAQAGRIDVLFANAGFYELGKFGDISAEHFDKTFNVNVRGLLFTVQKALPLMPDGAAVIMTGPIASIKGFEAFSVYNASKAAVRSFARSWIVDLKPRNIRINVLSPGHTQTPGLDGLLNDDIKAMLAAGTPLNRIDTGDDMANAALFLAPPESSFISGIDLFVDGGYAQI